MSGTTQRRDGRPPSGEEWIGPVADSGEPLPTGTRVVRFDGRIWSIVTDEVEFDGSTASRDVMIHPGAVAILALDDADRVLLIRQYRHPVGRWLFEPPAGLLDQPGERALATAQRELAEETGFEATDWHVLLDIYLSPGGSSEALRIYLARDLSEVPGGRPYTGEAEEEHLPRAWGDLDEARDLVLAGQLGSPSGVAGILAAWSARASGWSGLRPGDAPWPARDLLVAADRVHRVRRSGA